MTEDGAATEAADYRVDGPVTFHNLERIRKEGEVAIEAAGERVNIDLSGLEQANSAAVALLMAWYRAAEGDGKAIAFVDAPVALVNIVELSGMTEVLPIRTHGADPATSEQQVMHE